MIGEEKHQCCYDQVCRFLSTDILCIDVFTVGGFVYLQLIILMSFSF